MLTWSALSWTVQLPVALGMEAAGVVDLESLAPLAVLAGVADLPQWLASRSG